MRRGTAGVAVVWLDAHGDLNTPETSPSGNVWGMPLRMLIDSETVRPQDVVLIGARNLDPPEEAFIGESGIHLGVEEFERGARRGRRGVRRARRGRARSRSSDVVMFMPEPDGPTADEVRAILERIAGSGTPLAGFGMSAATGAEGNAEALVPFARAIGL